MPYGPSFDMAQMLGHIVFKHGGGGSCRGCQQIPMEAEVNVSPTRVVTSSVRTWRANAWRLRAASQIIRLQVLLLSWLRPAQNSRAGRSSQLATDVVPSLRRSSVSDSRMVSPSSQRLQHHSSSPNTHFLLHLLYLLYLPSIFHLLMFVSSYPPYSLYPLMLFMSSLCSLSPLPLQSPWSPIYLYTYTPYLLYHISFVSYIFFMSSVSLISLSHLSHLSHLSPLFALSPPLPLGVVLPHLPVGKKYLRFCLVWPG